MLAGEKNAPDIFTHPFQGSHLVQIKGPGVESNLASTYKVHMMDSKSATQLDIPEDPEFDKIKSIDSVQVKALRPETQRGLRRKSVEGN